MDCLLIKMNNELANNININLINNINVLCKCVKLNKKRTFDEISESTIQIRKSKYWYKRSRKTE